jgi:NADP-dependent 3-hydroxy acid dehydrogenase YdfG
LTCEEAYLLAKWMKTLSGQVRLALGPVPVVGEDDTYPKDRRGRPAEPVKFTIRAEKCPNRRGVEEVRLDGELILRERFQQTPLRRAQIFEPKRVHRPAVPGGEVAGNALGSVRALQVPVPEAEAIQLDVSNKANVNKAADQIVSKHGRIDLLVNSAGINVPKRSWADMELEGWDKLVEVNLNGVLYCMRAVLPAMRKQQDGCIINVASWAGRHVSKMPGPAYTTTKHAVLALTHSFNMDECVNGLRACCLSPGEVATPILKLRPVVPSEEEQAKMLQPEDCGRTIAFVASMPPRVCINEILISPTWNRGFIQLPHSRD